MDEEEAEEGEGKTDPLEERHIFGALFAFWADWFVGTSPSSFFFFLRDNGRIL